MTRPRPWTKLAVFTGGFGLLTWVPTWTLSGALAPLGLVLAALGWRSGPRGLLLWLALTLNTGLLGLTLWAWWDLGVLSR
jgi:hypothetical protein